MAYHHHLLRYIVCAKHGLLSEKHNKKQHNRVHPVRCHTIPENVRCVRRQDGVSVDEVLDGPHGHAHEVRGGVGVIARQEEGPEQILQRLNDKYDGQTIQTDIDARKHERTYNGATEEKRGKRG